ncbi:MAG: hypothetical protein KC464_06310 [Myxococcales bacterium]|nr:hypothetical protein [Myxococcales bacterium]
MGDLLLHCVAQVASSPDVNLDALPYVFPKVDRRAAFNPSPTSSGMRMLDGIGLGGVLLLVVMVARTGRRFVGTGAPGVQAAFVAAAVGLSVASTKAMSVWLFLAVAAVAMASIGSTVHFTAVDDATPHGSNVGGRLT